MSAKGKRGRDNDDDPYDDNSDNNNNGHDYSDDKYYLHRRNRGKSDGNDDDVDWDDDDSSKSHSSSSSVSQHQNDQSRFSESIYAAISKTKLRRKQELDQFNIVPLPKHIIGGIRDNSIVEQHSNTRKCNCKSNFHCLKVCRYERCC